MLQPDKEKSVNKVTVLRGKPQPSGAVVAPTSASISYTEKNDETLKRRKESKFPGSETEGVKVDKEGRSTAKPFTRKVIVSPGGHTRIIGDDGTVIKEGPARSSAIKDAVRESERKSAITNAQRERNARGNNLIGRTAENITQDEVDRLNASKQAEGNPTDPRVAAAAKREQELRDADQKKRAVRVKVKRKY